MLSFVAYGLRQISLTTFSANWLSRKLKIEKCVIKSSESRSSISFSKSKNLISYSPETYSIYFETNSSTLPLIDLHRTFNCSNCWEISSRISIIKHPVLTTLKFWIRRFYFEATVDLFSMISSNWRACLI